MQRLKNLKMETKLFLKHKHGPWHKNKNFYMKGLSWSFRTITIVDFDTKIELQKEGSTSDGASSLTTPPTWTWKEKLQLKQHYQ